MGRYGDAAVLEEARKRFQDHVSGEKLLPADLKSPVSHAKQALLYSECIQIFLSFISHNY